VPEGKPLPRALSEIDQRLSRSKAGFDFEARGPAEREVGDALYGGTPPRPQDLDAAFARHCRRTEAPERSRAEDSYARITLRGVEPGSGAECVLVADIRADGRWRFVLRVRRGP
jgi:hypothetical protein